MKLNKDNLPSAIVMVLLAGIVTLTTKSAE